ncbi:MAG TPA: M20/M25/M40 family metallo-hydrolase [Pyrinomonadaceae bacterium]|nr:M20/M25/M40 family metallo-hydrolase [Pyrinomonadaceae bacterium]
MFRKNLRYLFIIFTAILLVSTFVFFINRENTRADLIEFYVTIDENELNTVKQTANLAGNDLKFTKISTQSGVAVIKMSNGEIERLSPLMHEHFHKCAGFSAHETEVEARTFVENTFSADANAQLVDYTITNQTNVNQLLPEAQEIRVRQMITDLSAFPNRRYNQTSGTDSANFIKDQWTQIASTRPEITVEFFTHPTATSPQPSIILTIPGTTLPNEVVILGGHQDSINSAGATATAPGADDDASGIASLTEVIRVLVNKNFRPNRTVKFMAYAAEEVGLRGSTAIATEFQATGVNVVGVLQLDMTNFKAAASTLDFAIVTDLTNAAQNQFLRDLIAAYLPGMTVGNTTCGYACSDHSPWNSRGYPASFPHESTLAQSNPQIHKATDTISQSGSNANHALKFTKLGLTYVGELAKGQIQNAAPAGKRFDFDGDAKADVSVFRPSNQVWYLNRSLQGFSAAQFGFSTDKITPADYDGDGQTDIAIYRDGIWHLLRSQLGYTAIQFGLAGDIPQPADYDGDGRADVAVFRPSNGVWYLNRSTQGFFAQGFGLNGDKPVAADYDADGLADLAVFRNGIWHFQKSTTGYSATQFGLATDTPMIADFDGDRKTDISVFRNGIWHQLKSTTGYTSLQYGEAGDKPVPADFDGDGKDDVAVFRPNTGVWYILQSANGIWRTEIFGVSTDNPIPLMY